MAFWISVLSDTPLMLSAEIFACEILTTSRWVCPYFLRFCQTSPSKSTQGINSDHLNALNFLSNEVPFGELKNLATSWNNLWTSFKRSIFRMAQTSVWSPTPLEERISSRIFMLINVTQVLQFLTRHCSGYRFSMSWITNIHKLRTCWSFFPMHTMLGSVKTLG